MSLLIDDDIKLLRDSARRFFAGTDSVRTLRRLRDGRDFAALARGCWDGIVALGFSGILIPEEFGGAGLECRASIQIAEMMGRALATGPFLSTSVMSATALRHGSNAALKAALLPRIAAGTVVAFAGEEQARHQPFSIATRACREGDGFRISGRKIAVIDGNIAEKFIVVAHMADEPHDLRIFLVDSGAAGISATAGMGVDGRPWVAVTFRDVRATDADLVCGPHEALALLDRVYDVGRLHLAAEMLGAAEEAFERTLDYLKTRVQFGRRIGEFQALQHRAAILFGELEIARSTLLKAAESEGGDRFAEFVSLAKAKIGEVAKRVTTEAVQLHGGIGVTDDFDIGFYLKRAKASSEQLGDWAFHAERYAKIQGL